MTEYIQRKIRSIISEIEEKAADGNYIYRGEPEWHEQVSSSLWRQFQCRSTFASYDRADFDYCTLQKAYVSDARQYGKDLHQDNFEAASQLQHVGGNTNLIDFTTCYLVALFFACDGFPDKPGRVILLKQTEQITNKYKIKKPCNPQHRVKAQKSVFVQHSSGIIDEDDIEEIICICPCFKQPILTYLREKRIYAQTIYNDRHGYITRQKNHHNAYSEYGRGVLCYSHAANNRGDLNNNTDFHTAIEHFSNAIKWYPDFIDAYDWRGKIYLRVTGDFDKAIKDYTRVIELYPDSIGATRVIEYDPVYGSFYFMRGWAYSETGDDNRAKQDLIRAIELGDGNADHLLQEVQKRLNQ